MAQVLLIDGAAAGDVDSLQAKAHAITGVEVRGPASRLTLARSSIAEAAAADPAAPDRDSRLGLPAGWIVRALFAHQGADVDVSGCTLAASYTGFAAADGGTTATVTSTFLCDNVRSGAAAAGGAHVVLRQCSCHAAAAAQYIGAEAGDAGTSLALEQCSLQGNVSCGVMAYSAAAVSLKGCVSQRNGTAGCFAQVRRPTAPATLSAGRAWLPFCVHRAHTTELVCRTAPCCAAVPIQKSSSSAVD